VLGRNRLRAHPDLGAFTCENSARVHVGAPEASSSVSSLDGDWSFKLYASPEEVSLYAYLFQKPDICFFKY
jgi:hypothetical protein